MAKIGVGKLNPGSLMARRLRRMGIEHPALSTDAPIVEKKVPIVKKSKKKVSKTSKKV